MTRSPVLTLTCVDCGQVRKVQSATPIPPKRCQVCARNQMKKRWSGKAVREQNQT